MTKLVLITWNLAGFLGCFDNGRDGCAQVRETRGARLELLITRHLPDRHEYPKTAKGSNMMQTLELAR